MPHSNLRMNILVIGGGGREHALAWKLAQSPKVQMVYVAPGNGGTATDPRLKNLPITDIVELREWAQANKIGMTVVGPEGPLAAGVVDEFRAHGMRIFGPTQAAAQLESSKAFSKAFMRRHGIPTAEYDSFSDPVAAHAYVDKMGAPIVVKADGLAAGKGVVVAMNLQEAHEAIDFMLLDNTLGVTHNQGGARVVIEEFLEGEEASFIVMCDGKNVLALAASQDHKRLQDGDQGPNTGGMGAYSPAPIVTPEVHGRAMREVILPTIKGMESIDNAFFLMALQHGVLAPLLFAIIFVYAIVSQVVFGLKSPVGTAPLGFSFAGIYLMCFIAFASVYMGAQTEPLLFLLLGWGEGMKSRKPESDSPGMPAAAPQASHGFRRVLN